MGERHNGIRECGESDLRHLAGLEDLIARHLAVRAELGRHLVEGVGELAEFILRFHRNDLVELSLPELLRNGCERLDRLENRLLQSCGKENRCRHAQCTGANHIACGAGAEIARVAVCLHHGILVHRNDLLRSVVDPRECRQHLAEIHRAPFTKVGALPKYFGARRIVVVQGAQVVGQLILTRQRNVSQFRLEPPLENRKVLDVEIAAALLFANEREKQAGVHSFGGFFHLLTSEHAAKVFPQNDIHAGPKFCEK